MPAIITWWQRDLAVVHPDADPEVVFGVGADLMRRWDEPHRHYHTTVHLVEMFRALEELEDVEEITPREGALGRIATWLHDAVYSGGSGSAGASGEAESMVLAAEALGRLGVTAADTAVVTALIADTLTHEVAQRTGLPAAFHDADLWILSADRERFDEYCAQVREEYAQVADPLFAAGRRAVLEPFLRREHVYLTEHARAHWEPEARENLTRELARLGD